MLRGSLIIKNGNLIIDQDLEPDNFLGIIVRNEGGTFLDVAKGNIIVEDDVDIVEVVMYADGSLKGRGGNEQLLIVGSLFTKNTLYGAIDGNDECFKPGGLKVVNCVDAEPYDLAFIRMGSDDSIGISTKLGTTDYEDYSLIIKSDSRLQSNPPKGFK